MDWLRDKQVAATGRLAAMPHSEFAELVFGFGGVYTTSVNRQTSVLVVGSWPLQKDGRLTRTLRLATDLQRNGCDIEICTEDEFLFNLGLQSQSNSASRLYNLSQISKLLHIPRDRIRFWLREGWIQPVKREHGVSFFDFQQIVGFKTLSGLVRRGVSTERIRQSLQQLRSRMKVTDPFSQLSVLEENGRLLVRLGSGLAEPSGQLHLDFDDEREPAAPIEQPATHDDWFATGRKHETANEWDAAISAYRQALRIGGFDASTAFNLANVLYHSGRNEAAVERYYQVVETEPTFSKAWCNLGNGLVELEDFDEAIAAYEKAIDLEYRDAHFNLATTYEQLGQWENASAEWRAYLEYDSESEYGRHAAERVDAIENQNRLQEKLCD